MNKSNKIMKRNFLFWGKYGIQMTALLMGFVLLYGILFNIGDNITEKFWGTSYYYAVIIGLMFAFIGPICYAGAYIPLALSFGSGRKEAVWGSQLLSVSYAVTSYIFIALAGYMSSGKFSAVANILIAECFFLLTGLGQIGSILQMRYGKKGVVAGIVTFIILIFFGVGFAIGFSDSIHAWLTNLSDTFIWSFLTAGAVVSVIVYVISLVFRFQTVETLEVRY